MAKKLITYYTFEPTTNTVKVKGNIPAKRLLLITNVTDNVNIYNFADCLLYTSPSPRDRQKSRMPSSA